MILLSICIPIYNRSVFLDKMLMRFYKDKELFDEKIQLFVSDNCSEEKLGFICDKYKSQGLNLEYQRNEKNLGMDGNFAMCHSHAKGKYSMILGSDDIPEDDFFEIIIPLLENNNYGLIHLNNKSGYQINEYDDFSKFIIDINVWITFLSSNIYNNLNVRNMDLSSYYGSYLLQVPIYMSAAYHSKNLIISFKFLKSGNESKNNSGYNFFVVFIVSLLGIVNDYIINNNLDLYTYNEFKRLVFKNLLASEIWRRLIFRTNCNLNTEKGWFIVFRYYFRHLYTYKYLFIEFTRILKRKLNV